MSAQGTDNAARPDIFPGLPGIWRASPPLWSKSGSRIALQAGCSPTGSRGAIGRVNRCRSSSCAPGIHAAACSAR